MTLTSVRFSKPERHLRAHVHVVRDVRVDQQPVDVGFGQTRVVERQRDRFGGEID